MERVVMCLENEQYYLLSNLSATTGQLSQKPGTYVKLRADADPGVACKKITLCQFMAIQFQYSLKLLGLYNRCGATAGDGVSLSIAFTSCEEVGNQGGRNQCLPYITLK